MVRTEQEQTGVADWHVGREGVKLRVRITLEQVTEECGGICLEVGSPRNIFFFKLRDK